MIDTNTKAEKPATFDADLMGQKRQEKALREFKEVLHDLVLMLREATGMETVYMYWINRSRRQFVMETKATNISEVVFQDRIGFENHFLDGYKDIKEPVMLEIGSDINPEEINHYYGDLPMRYITLLPFINNGETVAITVVESADGAFSADQSESIHSYINVLGNVLNTYLEISDLYEGQNEWVNYEESLDFLNKKGHFTVLLQEMLNTIQGYLKQGGASLVAQTMGTWTNVMNAGNAEQPVPLGLSVEDRSVAKSALTSGKPEFAIHFNQNPKRVSPREHYTEGATLAIPMMFDDFRKGLVLIYDKNPLVFKESSKHKLINLVRLTGLKIQASMKNASPDDPLLTKEQGAIIPDLWERSVDAQIRRLQEERNTYHTWVGMVTLSDLSQIRTQFRLNELDLMQRDLVRIFNPGNFGVPGFIGFHADYIYLVVIQTKDVNGAERWAQEVQKKFSMPVQLTSGREIRTELKIGFEELSANSGDSYNVVSNVKNRLSE